MEAHNLLPEFYPLLVDAADEPEEPGRIACFSSSGPDYRGGSVACASATLLGIVLDHGVNGWPTDTPITIVRQATRPPRDNRPGCCIQNAEVVTLAEIFGGEANAQALVDVAYLTICKSNAEPVLTIPELTFA